MKVTLQVRGFFFMKNPVPSYFTGALHVEITMFLKKHIVKGLGQSPG